MRQIAVIIKHSYRDNDFRIDIVTVDDDVSNYEVRVQIQREMLGPFEVVGISERINFNRVIDFNQIRAKELTNQIDLC